MTSAGLQGDGQHWATGMLRKIAMLLSSFGMKFKAEAKVVAGSEDELNFNEELLRQAATCSDDADYFANLGQVTSADAKFWFDYARALSTLPASCHIDLRPNGRMAAAAVAIERAAVCDPDHVAIWGERLVIQRYLAHGLSAGENALSAAGRLDTVHSERTKLAVAQFKRTLDAAVLRFPDDVWFRDERQDGYDDFGWNDSE